MTVGRRIQAALLALALLAPGSGAHAQAVAPAVVLPDGDARPANLDTLVVVDPRARVVCAGGAPEVMRAEPLPPQVISRPPYGLARSAHEPYALAFSIDARGRVRDVRPDPAPLPLPGATTTRVEAQAAMMGWRFAPRVRADCRLEVEPVAIDLVRADDALKARVLAVAGAGPRPAVRYALRRPGDACASVVRRKLTTPPRRSTVAGGRAWAAIRFDIDADGRPRDLETLDASPDPEIVEAWREALAGSLYRPNQARSGCVAVYQAYGEAEKLEDAALPEVGDLNRCTPEQRARFTPARLTYPSAFEARGVEGWAVVRYDIASWGRPGDVEVLDAQPAAAFGDQARAIMQQGAAPPGFEHVVDCVDRVIFRLADDRPEIDDDD